MARARNNAHVSYQKPEPKTRGLDLTGSERLDVSMAQILEEALVLERIQSNPRFLLNKGLLILKTSTGVPVKGRYGETREGHALEEALSELA